MTKNRKFYFSVPVLVYDIVTVIAKDEEEAKARIKQQGRVVDTQTGERDYDKATLIPDDPKHEFINGQEINGYDIGVV